MAARGDLEVPRLVAWAEALLEESGVTVPRLNAEQLLAHCTGRTRIELYACPEAAVPEDARAAFAAAVGRRAAHEPLQYITGRKGFRYLELAVDRRVLIPRPETEMLAERALELLRDGSGHPVVVDVGTGSGCIALSLAAECPAAVVYATDISVDALEVARGNAMRLGLDGMVAFHLGDLLDALPRDLCGEIEGIISNPPYIKESDYRLLPPEVRDHEPRVSLLAGVDGIEVHKRLMEQARGWLRPGGWLIMEGGEDQVDTLASAARGMGYARVEILPDLNRRPRIVEMRKQVRPASPRA